MDFVLTSQTNGTVLIFIVSRQPELENLRKRFNGAQIIDVTSKSSEAWVKFNSFPPQWRPNPISDGEPDVAFEGIWHVQSLRSSLSPDHRRSTYAKLAAAPEPLLLAPARRTTSRAPKRLPSQNWIDPHSLAVQSIGVLIGSP